MARVPDNLGSCFYRDLLTCQGKAFYDCLVSHFIRKDYSGIIPIKITNGRNAVTDGFAAYKAVRDDHPEFFFLGNQCEFVRRGLQGTLKCSILYSESEIGRIQLQLRKLICRLVRGTAFLPVVEQERLVYERIAKKMTYVNNNDARDHNIVGPLLLSSGVCEGYNALLMLCFRRLEIPCIKVYGKSEDNERHCWCMVWINTVPVHCDITWDKPSNGILYYDYFNLSDRQIAHDHFLFKNHQIPVCIAEDLNFYHLRKCSFDSKHQLSRHIHECERHSFMHPIYLQASFAKDYNDLLSHVKAALNTSVMTGARGIHINEIMKTAVITK